MIGELSPNISLLDCTSEDTLYRTTMFAVKKKSFRKVLIFQDARMRFNVMIMLLWKLLMKFYETRAKLLPICHFRLRNCLPICYEYHIFEVLAGQKELLTKKCAPSREVVFLCRWCLQYIARAFFTTPGHSWSLLVTDWTDWKSHRKQVITLYFSHLSQI